MQKILKRFKLKKDFFLYKLFTFYSSLICNMYIDNK